MLKQVPGILAALQRSVQAVLLGKMHHPDWLSQGIRDKARTDLIQVPLPRIGALSIQFLGLIVDSNRYLLSRLDDNSEAYVEHINCLLRHQIRLYYHCFQRVHTIVP